MSATTEKTVPTVSLTILSDNIARPPLESEHGFAVWIATPSAKILFDTGAGPAMLRNADTLGIDLSEADLIVLSHGHYDHTGNLAEALRRAPRARLVLHPEALRPRYSIRDTPKFIGMPQDARDAIAALPPERLRWIAEPTAIAEGVWITGPVPRRTDFEDVGGPFFRDDAGRTPDDIPDDLSLWIDMPGGLVACLGCCHAGVVNTLEHIGTLTGGRPVRLLVGGMHLVNADARRLAATAADLKARAIPRIVPCHCTGDAASFLAEHIGPTVSQGTAGLVLDARRLC